METQVESADSKPVQQDQPRDERHDPVDDRSSDELRDALVRTSAEAKSYRLKARDRNSRISELEAELENERNAKLEARGKIEEQNAALKKRNMMLEDEKKSLQARYTYNTITAQVEREAAKMGCQNPRDLINLMAADKDFEALDYDEDTLRVSGDSLKTLLEKAREERSYLFGKPAPNIQSGVPATPEKKDLDLSKLSLTELAKLASSKRKEGK